MNLKCYFRYSKYLFTHRFYVMLACFKHGLIWRGLKHDLSKLNLHKEFIPYAKFFFSDDKPKRDETGYYKPHDTKNFEFERAWLHHVRKNSHHTQYWVNPKDKDVGGFTVLEMPEKDVYEMVLDWEGAGVAQKSTTNPRQWYEINKHRLILHENSRKLIEKKLKEWYPID